MTAITILVGVAMAAGVFGTLVPFVPGLTLVWAAALFYGVADGFDRGGWIAFGVITVLCALGLILSAVIPARRAANAGAAPISRLVGIIAAAVGFFVVPVVGLPIGGVAGVYLTELLRGASSEAAWRSTRATIIGLGVGFLAQLVLALLAALTWVVWLVFV